MAMKTEIDRICGIMYTLLEHQPVIDVPYEKINDIAVALVKEGYGKVSEYETEREMLGSKIKVLEQRLNNKYIEIDNLNRDCRNSFERLKAQEREIGKLKDENEALKNDLINSEGNLNHITTEIERLKEENATLYEARNNLLEENDKLLKDNVALILDKKQAKIDVLNKVKDIVFDYLGVKNIKEAEALSLLDSTLTYDVVTCGIDELIKEVQNENNSKTNISRFG